MGKAYRTDRHRRKNFALERVDRTKAQIIGVSSLQPERPIHRSERDGFLPTLTAPRLAECEQVVRIRTGETGEAAI